MGLEHTMNNRPPRKKQASFLGLPLELRIMIYEQYLKFYPDLSRERVRTYKLYSSRIYKQLPPRNTWDTLPALQAVNEQIYYEFAHMAHLNTPIHLSVTDNLFLTSLSQPPLLKFIAQPWLQEHVVELRIQFCLTGHRFINYGARSKNGETHGIDLKDLKAAAHPSKLKRTLVSFKNYLKKRPEQIERQSRNTLKGLAEVLNTFPQLKKIEIMFDHPDLLRTWLSIWDDLELLQKACTALHIVLTGEFEFDGLVEWIVRTKSKARLVVEDTMTMEIRKGVMQLTFHPSVLSYDIHNDWGVGCYLKSPKGGEPIPIWFWNLWGSDRALSMRAKPIEW